MNEINYNGTTIRVETITPQLAEIYLGKNTHNRNIRKPVVGKYANDMENGFWNFDGAPIRFADDGTLLDGQHRLHAIIKSNKAIDLLVVRGLKKRNAGNNGYWLGTSSWTFSSNKRSKKR